MGFGLTKSAAVTAALGTVPRAVLARVVVARARVRRPVLDRVWVAVRQVVVAVVLAAVGALAPAVVGGPAVGRARPLAAVAVRRGVQVTAKGLARDKETENDFAKKYQSPSRHRRHCCVS